MKVTKTWMGAAVGLAALVLGGNAVQADHRLANPLVALSEDLRCQADELRSAFREQFRQSAVFNELMWKSHEFRNTASRIRSLALSNGCPIRLRSELDALDRLVNDMGSLVEVARLRAARGLDKPLCGCTLHVDAKLARMRQSVWSMHRFLAGGSGVHRPWDYRYDEFRDTRGYRGYSNDMYYRDTHGRQVDPHFAINGPGGRAGVEFGRDGGIVVNIGGAGVRVR